MKVIEAQSAVLSNFEVHQHVLAQKNRYKKNRHRGPPNYETVVKEVYYTDMPNIYGELRN